MADTALLRDSVDRLLRETQVSSLRERRSSDRKAFVRPVKIYFGRDTAQFQRAFSKDISKIGLGLITEEEWQVGRLAVLEVHALAGPPAVLRAEVRWCEKFGRGWYLSGWHFRS